MQKLSQRETYTPTDAPQVRSNCGLPLNKEETLSVAGLKTRDNNPEVDLSQHTAKFKTIVYVISIDGKPLMPCTPAKAKKLLKAKRARVVKLYPFTIRLTFECENQVQKITLGMDSGYKNVGISCVSGKRELLSESVTLDDKTSSRLTERRMCRRLRRNKLWYRKPRFLNRKKPTGWLPPSVQRRYDTHLRLIVMAKAILPISKIVIETANFDIQKIMNPEISGIGYQQGNMYEYQNKRSYLMAREHGLCQLCHKEFSAGAPSHIHHVKQRNEEGSDRIENLAILHKKCHEKLHAKGLKLTAPKSYKPNTFMSIVHDKFKQDIPSAEITFGYITFIERQKLELEKSHNNDAFVIAGGTVQERSTTVEMQQKHRNNRVLQMNRNGFPPSIRKRRYPIQPKDFIWINGKICIATGIHCKGKRVIITDGKSVLVKKVERVYHFSGFAIN